MIGASCSSVPGFAFIRPGLLATFTPTPRQKHTPRLFHGKHPVIRPQAGAFDDLILEIRRLYEQALMPPSKIHAHITGLGYEKTLSWVRQTCQYSNRSHLVPTDGAATYLPESQP